MNETETACALREFTEETGIPKKCVNIIKNESPLYEEYIGTNGIPYKQVYFIGICDKETIASHQPNNKVMNREVGNIGWFKYEEAFQKIRETNKEKRAVLKALDTRIKSEPLNSLMRSIEEWHDA